MTFHPFGLVAFAGRILASSVFAPSSQVQLTASSNTFAAPNVTATTVAAGSNGGLIQNIASWSSPSAGVLAVASTTGYPTAGGTLTVTCANNSPAVISYTGISGSTFTGCTYVSGGTGAVTTGGAVTLTSVVIATGSFLAPASGGCYVDVAGNFQTNTNAGKIFLNVGLAGTVTPIGEQVEWADNVSGSGREYLARIPIPVGTLTPGTSYNLALLMAVTAGQIGTILCLGAGATTGGTLGGSPLVLTVTEL